MPDDDAPPVAPLLKSSDLDETINESASWRRATLGAYLVLIALGVPYWWYTTSIGRLALPVSAVKVLGSQINDTLGQAPFRASVGCHASVTVCPSSQAQAVEPRAESRGWTWADPTPAASAQDRSIVLQSLPASADVQDAVYTSSGGVATLLVPPAVASDSTKLVALLDEAFPLVSQSHRAIGFSPNITLSFVLLNEDSSAGGYIADWPIAAALEEHLLTLVQDLTRLHKFTIETQILYHAPLRFQPSRHTTIDGGDEWVVSDDQVKNFVNTEQWSLDSGSSNNPVLRFLLFVPSAAHTPMRLASSRSPSPSFLIPQYGGVVIHNPATDAAIDFTLADLDQPFRKFTAHLQALLGLPTLPDALATSSSDGAAQWQLDTLVRMRTRENFRDAVDTLTSIVRLVTKLKQMKVGRDVQGDVQGAVAALQKILSGASTSSQQELFDHSRDAVWLANRAFFHPSMVSLLYFPPEHFWAVMAPLFAPISVPLVISLVKEVKQWRGQRRRALAKGA